MYQYIKVFLGGIIFILMGVVTVKDSRANENIVINSHPSSVTAGTEFDVGFKAEGLAINSNYNIKGLGGESFTEVDTWNNQWLQQNAAWDAMPAFASGDGSPSGTFKVRFDVNAAGTKDFKIRIKKADSSNANIDSSLVSILVNEAPPAPTPVPSPTKTPTPNPTTAAEPSSQVTSKPTSQPTLRPTPKETPEVLALETSQTPLAASFPAQTPSVSENTSRKFPFLPIILILLGFGFIGFAVYKSGIITSCVKKPPSF